MSNNPLITKANYLHAILLFVIVVTLCQLFVSSSVYAEIINSDEKKIILDDVLFYRSKINEINYHKEDMLFFPALKGFITDSESDSIYLEYIDWLLNNNLNKINSFERLDEIVQELSRIYQFLSIINPFKELIDKVPPVVHLEEFILADKLTDKLRKGIPIEITVDTVKLELFSCCTFLLRFGKGAKNYDLFVKNMRTEPFLDILTDMMSIRENGSDTLAIIKNVIHKIIKSDERVRMLAFGYYGLCIARNIWARVNSRLYRIYQNKSIQTSNDSVYVEFFTSDLFKQFGEIYKEYSQKIDSMKIDVNYGNLYSPVVFEEAISIKEYLQKEAKETEPMNKK